MKSSEVIKILNISRPTLCNYIKSGKIKATKLGNGYYDDKSVYKFINKPLPNLVA
jgi:predicted site-specific integrase-resolvase